MAEAKRKKATLKSRNLSSELPQDKLVSRPTLDGLPPGEPPNLLQDETPDSTAVVAIQPYPRPADLDVRRWRSEIPDTPDPRSSELPIDNPVPKSSISQAGITSSIQTKDDLTLATAFIPQGLQIDLTTLCQTCKKQPGVFDRHHGLVRW